MSLEDELHSPSQKTRKRAKIEFQVLLLVLICLIMLARSVNLL